MGKMTIEQMMIQLAGGMGTSIQIFLVTLIFSLPLGLLVAFGRMSKNRLLQAIVKVYISVSYTHLLGMGSVGIVLFVCYGDFLSTFGN